MAIVAATLLIFDVVEGLTAGVVAAGLAGLVVFGLWGALPAWERSKSKPRR